MIKKLARYGILHSLFFILSAMLLILSGCDATSDRSDKPSPDWSRGLRIGVASINQPVALQVDPVKMGGHAHLVWYTRMNGEWRMEDEVSKLRPEPACPELALSEVEGLHYIQLDDQAKVVMERDLDIPLSDPHKPQLLLDKRGNMHLALLAREDGVKNLFHFLLGYDGEVLSEPTRLSPPSIPPSEGEVESYQICLGQEGRIEVFWSAEEGIYYLCLDERGVVISPPTLIVPQGTNPSAQVDSSGTIHLTWLQEPSSQVKELYYAAFKPQQAEDSIKGTKLTQFSKVVSAILRGPVLGLDMEYAYVFWSLEQRSGLEPGTARSYYVSFPLGQLSASENQFSASESPPTGQAYLSPTPIRIPNREPVYTPSQGEYNYRQLAYPLEKWASDFVATPSVVEGQRGESANQRISELAVMFNVKVGFGRKAYLDESKMAAQQEMPVRPGFKPKIQLVMAIFTKGKMKGYQVVAKTDSASLRPNLQVDAASDLHLAWLDTAGFRQYDVYYASTSPEAKAWLDRTSPQDILLKAVELAWRMLSGVALLPLVGFWIIPPLIWVVLFYIFVGEEELELRRVKVALGIAIALYMGAKLVLLPNFLLYVPFLDQVPPHLSSALILGVPLIILALALAAMYAYTRRTERATLFLALFVFALTDALLSLAVYASSFFGGL